VKLEISDFFLFFQHFFMLLQNIENQQFSTEDKYFSQRDYLCMQN